MNDITIDEAALFLMLLSANFERDPIKDSIQGELSDDSEQFILKCINRLAFFEDLHSQKQLETAIHKFDELKDISSSTAEIIQHCAKPLLISPEDRDMVYYLCNEIIYLKGRIEEDSKEEKYLSKLDYYLKVDSTFASTIYFIAIINNILRS